MGTDQYFTNKIMKDRSIFTEEHTGTNYYFTEEGIQEDQQDMETNYYFMMGPDNYFRVMFSSMTNLFRLYKIIPTKLKL